MSTATSYLKTAYVAIDMGKNVHWFGAYTGLELETVQAATKLRSNQNGLAQVCEVIDQLLGSGEYDRVVLGHEPTGIYHENWARALLERYEAYRQAESRPQFEYRFLNPLLVKKERETMSNGRLRKTDPLDVQAMAHCLQKGLGYPAFLPSGQELQLALWTRTHRQLQMQQREAEMRVLAELDRLWPGLLVDTKRFARTHPELEPPVPLVLSKPLSRQSVQAILQHCPNPHEFAALGVAGIQTFFRQHIGRCGEATARKAYQLVTEAVLPPPEVAVVLVLQLQREVREYMALAQREQELAAEAEQLVPHTPAAVLTTIPGISPYLAARYLGYLKQHQRFDSAAQVWAFAGFDPVLEESGDYRRVGKMSRKGNPGLRDTLYLMGYHTARHLPTVGQAYQQALGRGKGKVGATLHAAHKTNRLCYRLLYEQRPFDPQLAGPLD